VIKNNTEKFDKYYKQMNKQKNDTLKNMEIIKQQAKKCMKPTLRPQ
jgi:hypothetical protein